MKKLNNLFAIMQLAFAFIICYEASAQSTFMRMYNKGNMAYVVREVNGNRYVAAGGTDYYFNWHWFIQSSLATTNIHLFETDDNGVLQWERVISKLNTRLIARWMEPTVDGGFILTGSANHDAVWPPDSNDIVLIKTDASGMVSWSKMFDTGKDDLGFCVQQTADTGFIISGFYDSSPVSLLGNTYIVLLKTDSNGVLQWEKKYQFAMRDLDTHEAFSYVVKQTADGGYVVTGSFHSTHPIDLNVLRTDASGNVLWAKTYDHDGTMFRNSLGLDVIETLSGDLLVAGAIDKDTLHYNYPYFLSLSSTGVPLKARFYETLPVLSFQSGYSSVQQTVDGGFFFTGMGGYSSFGDQAQLLKTDLNLNVQWSRVYTADGAATMGSKSGRQTSDGGYVFAGKRQLSGTALLKTNSLGFVDCKNPASLIEYIPSPGVHDWTPIVISGISESTVFLTVTSPLVDTTIVCPVGVSSLPVELNYFSASALPEQQVEVEWTTASEINNDYFVVEKSANNKTFEEAGKIKGAGNSTSSLNYSFVDEKPYLSPVSYYRLKQVDYDGAHHISDVVPVSFGRKDFEVISTSANFSTHIIKIVVNDFTDEDVQWTMNDVLGKIISKGNYHCEKGLSSIMLNAENLSHGIYFFSINNGEKNFSEKIVY